MKRLSLQLPTMFVPFEGDGGYTTLAPEAWLILEAKLWWDARTTA